MSDQKARLKEAVRRVVVGQGNRFIKELLRDKGLAIGTTKSDFTANLMKAIDDGELSVADVESWLVEVEGWGNQHIYFYAPPTIEPNGVRAAVNRSSHAPLLWSHSGLEFPDQLKLTTIDLQDQYIALSWHRENDRWIHVAT